MTTAGATFAEKIFDKIFHLKFLRQENPQLFFRLLLSFQHGIIYRLPQVVGPERRRDNQIKHQRHRMFAIYEDISGQIDELRIHVRSFVREW